MCDIIRYHIVAITDRRSNCPFRTAFYRTWMRPGLSVHHPLHTGAFRCTSIPGNDRRTNGVCLYRNLPYAACIRMDRKYDQPSLIPGISAFHLGSYVRNARKNLKADSKKTATVPTSYIPAGIIGHDDTLPEFEYNPEKAKSLLAEAGFPDGINLRVTVNTKYQGNVAIATAFQQQAKAAGINVEVEQVDSAAWSDMKKNGGVDCGIANWYVDYSDPESMLYPMTKTDSNSSFWHNDEFDRLLAEGIATTDTAERQEIYAKAEHIMTREDWATTPLYNETKFYLLNPTITGFEMDSTFRMFWENADIQQ